MTPSLDSEASNSDAASSSGASAESPTPTPSTLSSRNATTSDQEGKEWTAAASLPTHAPSSGSDSASNSDEEEKVPGPTLLTSTPLDEEKLDDVAANGDQEHQFWSNSDLLTHAHAPEAARSDDTAQSLATCGAAGDLPVKVDLPKTSRIFGWKIGTNWAIRPQVLPTLTLGLFLVSMVAGSASLLSFSSSSSSNFRSRPTASGSTFLHLRSGDSTAILHSCPPCSCRVLSKKVEIPPRGIDPTVEPQTCDVQSLPACFEELNATSAEARQRAWFGSGLEEVVTKFDDATRARPTCADRRVILLGDSHSRMRTDQMWRLFHRRIIQLSRNRPEWTGSVSDEMVRLLDEVLCDGDILATSLASSLYDKSLFANIIEPSIQVAKRKSARVIFWPDNLSLSAPAFKCVGQDLPTSCGKSHSKVREEVEELQGTVEKYQNDTDVLIFHDLDHLCRDGFCDIYIPGTRTIAIGDMDHHTRMFEHFLQPFLCDSLLSAGFI